jgi:hypothetical protein
VVRGLGSERLVQPGDEAPARLGSDEGFGGRTLEEIPLTGAVAVNQRARLRSLAELELSNIACQNIVGC